MATTVLFEEQVEIPLSIRNLTDFRRWASSDCFPENGRIDYLAGRIEVDMSPEEFISHGTLKSEIVTTLNLRVKQQQIGYLVTDSTRVSCPRADLSTEPDVVFVSYETLSSGKARLVPKATGEPERYVELEGAPDLVVEIVSDRSVKKDTQRLPAAYFSAGVREFWLADARGEQLMFQIYRPGETAFEPAGPDAEGYQPSAVFGCRFRLDRSRDVRGLWTFDLRQKP